MQSPNDQRDEFFSAAKSPDAREMSPLRILIGCERSPTWATAPLHTRDEPINEKVSYESVHIMPNFTE